MTFSDCYCGSGAGWKMWRISDVPVSITHYRDSNRATKLKRLLQRLRLRREQLRAVRGDHHVILETDAEFAADVDAGLVAERHARLRAQVACPAEHVVLHEIRPLVSFHADAVSEAVGEELEAGAVAGVGDDFARGRVDRLPRRIRFGRGQPRVL